MAKFKAILFFIAVVALAFGTNAMAAGKFDTSSGSFAGTAVTTSQTAVFAAFLSNVGPSDQIPSGINTAISVSNILAVPPGLQSDFINIGGSDDTGTVTFFLYDRDGTGVMYDTGSDCSAGIGLNPDGTLGPGQTYTVLLADILECAVGDRTASFNGYGWVVGNFDAIAGTYNVTIFDIGFTQNFELTPAVGQGQTFTGGIPVSFSNGN